MNNLSMPDDKRLFYFILQIKKVENLDCEVLGINE